MHIQSTTTHRWKERADSAKHPLTSTCAPWHALMLSEYIQERYAMSSAPDPEIDLFGKSNTADVAEDPQVRSPGADVMGCKTHDECVLRRGRGRHGAGAWSAAG